MPRDFGASGHLLFTRVALAHTRFFRGQNPTLILDEGHIDLPHADLRACAQHSARRVCFKFALRSEYLIYSYYLYDINLNIAPSSLCTTVHQKLFITKRKNVLFMSYLLALKLIFT